MDKMIRRLARLRSARGFTLVSVMTAVVLMSVGVVALSAAGIYVLAVKTDSSARSTAVSIGVAYMEEVKTRDPTTLASEDPVRLNEAGQPDPAGHFVRTLSVVADPDVDESKRMKVKVGYPAGRGRAGSVELVTIIYEGT